MSPALQKISQDDMVQRLVNQDFLGFHSNLPKTTKEAFDKANPMLVVNQLVPVQAQLEFELIQVSRLVNIDNRLNLQPHQIPIIAESIYDQWKTLSLEEVGMVLRRGAAGFYGAIFRLDGAIVNEWLSQYSDERSSLQEHSIVQQKELEDVDYERFKERLETERKKQKESTQAEINRNRAIAKGMVEEGEYKQPAIERVVMNQLKVEYGRIHTDLTTGRRKPDSPSFEEFCKTQAS
jgi:hypothetical protein